MAMLKAAFASHDYYTLGRMMKTHIMTKVFYRDLIDCAIFNNNKIGLEWLLETYPQLINLKLGEFILKAAQQYRGFWAAYYVDKYDMLNPDRRVKIDQSKILPAEEITETHDTENKTNNILTIWKNIKKLILRKNEK